MRSSKWKIISRTGRTAGAQLTAATVGLPRTFCMKWNIVLDIPPNVVQAIADLRPLRKFKRAIPKKPSFLQQWGIYVVLYDDYMIKGCREVYQNTSNCNNHLYEKLSRG